ncbi:hypothetical protein PMAYCL1PPCAC_26643, partial [Pristionchus mayeri]
TAAPSTAIASSPTAPSSTLLSQITGVVFDDDRGVKTTAYRSIARVFLGIACLEHLLKLSKRAARFFLLGFFVFHNGLH